MCNALHSLFYISLLLALLFHCVVMLLFYHSILCFVSEKNTSHLVIGGMCSVGLILLIIYP